MTNLSPAAQAVLDAYYSDTPLPGSKRVAAALRAAADAVVDAHDGFTGTWKYDSIYAIAAELEGQ